MSSRNELSEKIIVNNSIYTVTVLDHPLIDDVVISEAMIRAEAIVSGNEDTTRRVDRSIRDFLVRLGVEK
jgi:hypothetical protein